MKRTWLAGIVLLNFFSCQKENVGTDWQAKNTLDFSRNEVISIPLDSLPAGEANSVWLVKTGSDTLASQLLDINGDSIPDQLIFAAALAANEEKSFSIAPVAAYKPHITTAAYSRFVPERIDDYAWENDLVAFRTYGPEAQRLVDNNEKGGTLSSGLDCWLKRVNYPIIDKWYKKYVDGGTYHKDDGEGYDPYHVGKSRGCGGLGIWIEDSLYVSKNFVSYKPIANGPVRNIFELTYATWQAGGTSIEETKRITIDLGNQLYQVHARLKASQPLPNITIGITLHDKKGQVSIDSIHGAYSYWEPQDDSEIGTGVVISPEVVQSQEDYRTTKADLSHIYVHAKPAEEVTYYTGFAWKKTGHITNATDWQNYLRQFSKRLQEPVIVTRKR